MRCPRDLITAPLLDPTCEKLVGKFHWLTHQHKVSAKRNWRKLHIVVDDKHVIHGSTLTDRFVADESVIEELVKQTNIRADCATADGAYDSDAVYETLFTQFPDADIVIPPN